MRFLISLLALIFLGSCVSLGKGVVIKRKYNKGYHIDLASRKKTEPVTKPETQENASDEPVEVVVVGKQKSETICSSKIAESPKTYSTGSQPHFGSKSFNQASPLGNVTQTLVKNAEKFKTRNAYNDLKIGLGVILFVVLTIIYTITILYRYPGFPFLLAVVLAMLGALLTIITGATF